MKILQSRMLLLLFTSVAMGCVTQMPSNKAKAQIAATNLSPAPIKTSRKEYLIAIDPGHGGVDPGAVGQKGTLEKDITLAISKKLEKIINSTSGFRAILTRDGDRDIALRNRVRIARDNEADLFLSIHADSFKGPEWVEGEAGVEGGSVYALSRRGASLEAAKWIEDKDDLTASVLLDLSQTATIQASLELGSVVLKQMGLVVKLNKKRVLQAGFAVLTAPDMPSIYINIASISNPKDEQRLNSTSHQQNIANAIFTGINLHIKNRLN